MVVQAKLYNVWAEIINVKGFKHVRMDDEFRSWLSGEMVYGVGIENAKSMLKGSGKYIILLVWGQKKAKMPCQNKHFL